ncbi:MAG TPA: hypothetical protein VMD99_15435 [Terriglobales bacterium]|nr:hypothetical protein [Terriglobales bacterium]
MSRLRPFGQLAAGTVFFALLFAAGCSHPAPVPGTAGTRSSRPEAPFDNHELDQPKDSAQDSALDSNDEPAVESPDNSSDFAAGVPFRDRHSLPAGTLLTVRLDQSISSDAVDEAGTFAATVDEPVVVDGVTLIPRGAAAAGRVESARTSAMKRDRGYVRLTLATVDIAGQDLRVHTSSLFARANTGSGAAVEKANAVNVIHLDKGRRLTFRLTGPVYVASEQLAPTR